MTKKKELSIEKELEAARKLVLFADSQTRVSVVVNGKPVNHYKEMAFVCWLDYLILFTKAKKKFPYMVADEFHKIRLNKEKKFEMMQTLFKHFIETDTIDDEIRQCLYTIIAGTNSLGGRDWLLSNRASFERYLAENAADFDITSYKAAQDLAVLFFYYLFIYFKVNAHNTKKADIVSFLTGFDNESTRQQFSNVFKKANINFDGFADDMKIVRALFQKLNLTQVFTLIDNDLDRQEKKTEKKL